MKYLIYVIRLLMLVTREEKKACSYQNIHALLFK
jgi:hypothetical protein